MKHESNIARQMIRANRAEIAKQQGEPAWDEAFIKRLHALGWTINQCPVCGNSVSGTLPPPAHTEEELQSLLDFVPDDIKRNYAEPAFRLVLGVPAP